MMTIKPLNETTFEELFSAFSDAFQDYERSFSKDEFSKMLHRRGYVAELSFGAFDGSRLVSFILNGLGSFNGEPSVYDTGTGTLKEYREKGLIGQIFDQSLPLLQQAGVTQYILEVLSHNDLAVSKYLNLGFEKTRDLNYYTVQSNQLKIESPDHPSEITFKDIDFRLAKEMEAMFDFQPSWQNSFPALLKSVKVLKSIGAFKDDKFVGFGIIEPATGDIPQLAVMRAERRKGIGTALFKKLVEFNLSGAIKIINVEPGCMSATSFIEKLGVPKNGAQYEMLRMI